MSRWIEWIRTNRVALSFGLLFLITSSGLIWYWERGSYSQSTPTSLDEQSIQLLEQLSQENDRLLTEVETLKSQVAQSTSQPAPLATPAVAGATTTAVPPASTSGTVNLNTADQALLETLPGIGPSKAQAILDYRALNGPFQKPDQLKDVKGIGDKTYEQLAPLVTVN